LSYLIIAQLTRPFSSPITVTLKRLVALLEEDDTDEYGVLQPSQAAFKLAMGFIIEAYDVMGDRFPKASASTDEQGGIRLTWSKLEPECEVRLICPAHTDQQAYLYHELGNDYAVEREVTVSILLQWLEWLSQV
ncbi:hypothetical protein MEN24_17050, partial [Dolichospermum sp. ST_sed10]|nr:hypothetical protein [Dolichospermum sp. ST_sed10]